MGITGLSLYLKANNLLITNGNLNDIRQTGKIAVDANWLLYRLLYAAIKGAKATDDEEFKDEVLFNLTQGIIYNINMWLTNGFVPIYVFDGCQHLQAKAGTLSIRKNQKEAQLSNLKVLKNQPDQSAYLEKRKRTVHAESEHYNLFMSTLTTLGIPWLKATDDAEKLCAAMNNSGLVDAVFSSDTDTLTFGANIVITELVGKNIKKWNGYRRAGILASLDLTQEEFIDFCILSGSDYSGGLKGVAVKTALNLMQKHGSLEKIVQLTDRSGNPKWSGAEIDRLNFLAARQQYSWTDWKELILVNNSLAIDLSKFYTSKPLFEEYKLEKYYNFIVKSLASVI